MAKKAVIIAVLGFTLGVLFSSLFNYFYSNSGNKSASKCIEKIYACEKGGSCGEHTVNIC